MKKLKEVTDKKKTSLLKTIDEKLTEAAGELGLSLEQRTVRMKQRGKKVRVSYGSLCRFRLEGLRAAGVGSRSPFPPTCISSPPLLRRAALAPAGLAPGWLRAGLEGSCMCGRHGTGHPFCGCRAQARPVRSLCSLGLPVAHLIAEERLCASHLLTFLL